MQVAMSRIQRQQCVFADPQGLVQEIIEKGERKTVAILKDRVFLHFTRTALVAEKDEEERKYRRKVVKVGIDPHFSYAYMLLNVAWARAHGTSTFIIPRTVADERAEAQTILIERELVGVPVDLLHAMTQTAECTCGRCTFYREVGSLCTERGVITPATAVGCELFM